MLRIIGDYGEYIDFANYLEFDFPASLRFSYQDSFTQI